MNYETKNTNQNWIINRCLFCSTNFKIIMRNYQITKKQILQAHNAGFIRIKEWFPEAFKTELVVGKWYNITNIACGSHGFSGIGQYTEETNQSGLFSDSEGYNFKETSGRIWRTNGNITDSANQEVETALIAEAKKRGFFENVMFESPSKNFKHTICGNFNYDKYRECLFNNGIAVYNKGKWATIISTITKSEAEKRLGVKIE